MGPRARRGSKSGVTASPNRTDCVDDFLQPMPPGIVNGLVDTATATAHQGFVGRSNDSVHLQLMMSSCTAPIIGFKSHLSPKSSLSWSAGLDPSAPRLMVESFLDRANQRSIFTTTGLGQLTQQCRTVIRRVRSELSQIPSMDLRLRRVAFHLMVAYWAGLWLLVSGSSLPLPLLLLAYPIYRCCREYSATRIWFLGALVSVALTCIPAPASVGLGLITFLVFYFGGNLHLSVRLRNPQASLLFAFAIIALPLAGVSGGETALLGVVAEGFGLLLLWLSAPVETLSVKT